MRYVLTSPMWLTMGVINTVNTIMAGVSHKPFFYVFSAVFMVIGINLAFTKETK